MRCRRNPFNSLVNMLKNNPVTQYQAQILHRTFNPSRYNSDIKHYNPSKEALSNKANNRTQLQN